MKRHAGLGLILLMALGCLQACRDAQQNQSAPAATESAPAATETAPSLQSQLPAQKAVAEPPSERPNMLSNASFEEWANSIPVAWLLHAGQISPLRDLNEGQTVLRLLPNNTPLGTRVYQPIHVDQFAGRKFEAKVRARANSNLAYLYVIYYVGGKPKVFQTRHSGSGAWEVLSIADRFPMDADPKHLALRVNLLPNATDVADFDQAEFRFLD